MEAADGKPELEVLQDRIGTALRDPLEEQWDEVLDQWKAASPQRTAVRTTVADLRDRLLEGLLEMGSVERFNRALLLGYVEVKCHWMRLNAQIQDQTAQNEQAAPKLLYRATCVSLLLQALDPLLSRERMDGGADVLVEPLG